MNFECWHDFFELSEDAESHALNLRVAGLEARLFWPHIPMQVTPYLLTESVILHQTQIYSTLLDALLRLPDVMFDGDYAKFANAVGFDSEKIAGLLKNPDQGLLPCRWDLCQKNGQWFVFEANFGGALGGLPTEGMHALYDTFPLPDGHICDSWVSAGQLIAQSFERRFGSSDTWQLVVVDDADTFQKSPLTANSVASLMERHLGQDIPAIAHTELDEFARSSTKQLVAFELFTLSDITRDLNGSFDAYLSHCALGTVKRGISLLCDLYMSKACLALLHEAADQQLYDPSVCNAIHSAIPKTRLVTSEDLNGLGELPKDDLVLKSAIGYGGTSVFCGWEQSQADWSELLRKMSRQGLYVLQKRVQGDREPSISVLPDGMWIESDAPQVLGIFQIDGQLCGGITRQAMAGDGVVNAARQASVGLIRRVSRNKDEE